MVRKEEGWPDSTLKGMNSLVLMKVWVGGSWMITIREGARSYTIMYKSVGSDLMALNHGLGRFRNGAHGLSRAVHDQDPYGPGRFFGI
ncbi:hypothetical protein F2Q70_00027242 [Brassica cretica]|uniref:Uncharacterized protein n=1 Tax=Brassica cretica TaxID=69181 RepID=A0A8S9LBP4_BRACR|nr:hypothetical protein F2Q70_00027242 [Brassica cretica]